MSNFGYFLLAVIFSFVLTWVTRKLMLRWKVVDEPKKNGRKIHKVKIPLGGGLAVFTAFFLLVLIVFTAGKLGNDILPKHLWGLFAGGLILMVGGFWDDKFGLKARYQALFAVSAALIVIAFGIGSRVITNPFGNIFSLKNLVVLSDFLVFFWLMGMMFTTKILDGLDGLVTGIVAIGALMIFFLSNQTQWYQPSMALLALIFAGACLGFLVWNWHPAKIFLGQGGSMFTGFLLGSLAIISGGKIATTLLVVGIPILDILRVIFLRLIRKKPLFVGDKEHLHFRLLNSGLRQRQAVLLFYSISFLFGLSTLFLQSRQKMVALTFLLVLMMLVGVWFSKRTTNN
jgi:UDP-GlcNAc:undecaprenyl-phosphate GlcNAc-1-phosphate transferase